MLRDRASSAESHGTGSTSSPHCDAEKVYSGTQDDQSTVAGGSPVAHHHRGRVTPVVAARAARRPAGLQVVGVGVDVVRGLPRCRRTRPAAHVRMDAHQARPGERRRGLRFSPSPAPGVRRSQRAVPRLADRAHTAHRARARVGVQRHHRRLLDVVARSARQFLRSHRAPHAGARRGPSLLRVGVPLALAAVRFACQPDYGWRLPGVRCHAEHLWRGARRADRGGRGPCPRRRSDNRVAAAAVPSRPRERLRDVRRARAALRGGLPAVAAGAAGEPQGPAGGRGRESRAPGGDRGAATRGRRPATLGREVRRGVSLEPVRDGDHALRRGHDHRCQRRLRSPVRLLARRVHRQQLRQARILGRPVRACERHRRTRGARPGRHPRSAVAQEGRPGGHGALFRRHTRSRRRALRALGRRGHHGAQAGRGHAPRGPPGAA